jgi:cytochrome c553
MRKVTLFAIAACVGSLSVVVSSQQAAAPAAPPGPSWAFQVVDGKLPPEPPGPKQVPGSKLTFEMEQIENLLSPPDWFPETHPPAPGIIVKGHGGALACGSCHLMNGLGHPESADVSGFTAAYLEQQMKDFKSGVRADYARMNAIAKELSDEEISQASGWFAQLKPARSTRVVEAAMVPQSFVGQGRMRFVQPGGKMEPIGARIITLPEDQTRARLRDPNSGFVAYVPPGSIARGKALVETGGGGKTIACAICHGDAMKGLGNVPRLAGLHPIYTARQLYLFKDGRRNGVDAQLMKKPTAKLTDDDIIALSAYLASLAP